MVHSMEPVNRLALIEHLLSVLCGSHLEMLFLNTGPKLCFNDENPFTTSDEYGVERLGEGVGWQRERRK